MRLRTRLMQALEGERTAELETLVAGEPRVVRHLLGLSYHSDDTLRAGALRALKTAARHHPDLVQNLVRRLVWAMNDESGTNALTAPAVVRAIAEEAPRLLIPMVPDLIRLSADPGLQEGLAQALRLVVKRCPGEVGKGLQDSLDQRFSNNGCGCHDQ